MGYLHPGIRRWRRYPHSAPEKRAFRSSSGVCELDSATLKLAEHSSNRMEPPEREKTASGGIPSTQVFAHGEDTLTLRLKSELFDLRVGFVNWILLRQRLAERSSNRMEPPEREKTLLKRGALVLEVPPRFELGIEVLQTFALPLGYGTEYSF